MRLRLPQKKSILLSDAGAASMPEKMPWSAALCEPSKTKGSAAGWSFYPHYLKNLRLLFLLFLLCNLRFFGFLLFLSFGLDLFTFFVAHEIPLY